ncbi:hypothetical protein [Saccharothrix deserti]|uniref:hypothetical protein n=1 Tax=Saccharothrix deserti TaxID=2593674 RepID=UPI00131E0FF2|nr:hypothetical protein [Saccharothrix deserti]
MTSRTQGGPYRPSVPDQPGGAPVSGTYAAIDKDGVVLGTKYYAKGQSFTCYEPTNNCDVTWHLRVTHVAGESE